MPNIRLTQYASGGGCACKLPADLLEQLVTPLGGGPSVESLTVGLEHGDDAAVYQVSDENALILTADFFAPVVDDPFTFGRIAATNALSDIYAMGGKPLLALNLVAWPSDLPHDCLAEVLRGGQSVATAAGCLVVGGHSISAPEPLYGLAVVGFTHPQRLLRLDTAQPNQPVALTKPIGTGILNAAHKATGNTFSSAVQVMTQLNDQAAAAAVHHNASAATDVTGFGLLGHLWKLARASNVSITIDHRLVPVLDEARSLADAYLPGGSKRNLEWVRPHVKTQIPDVEPALRILADAQTSGGLLVVGAVPELPIIGHTQAAGAEGPTLLVV